jgi:SAM-dependent MidA family methyltransferase
MSLRDVLIRRIAATGPLSMADYMSDCLLHPDHGYYSTRDPLGAGGDFTTAPEISQMFGELLGLSLAQTWMDQGCPAPFTLAEPGPGRGTLMADLLRATRGVPDFHAAMQIRLIEASPALKDVQARTLADCAPEWIGSFGDLPEQPLFLVANEFFDVLPVRQFQRDGAAWRERQVGVQDNALTIGLGPAGPQPALAHRLDDTRNGDLVEICPAAPRITEAIAGRIARNGGAALIVDYGDWRSLGDTLQALQNHAPVDILAAPGESDLTAHVDFETLTQAAAAAGARFSRLAPQGVFLERLGVTQRAQALARTLKGDALEALIAAHRRLTHPEEMGNLFKVLGLFPAQAAPPPGLEP